MQRIDTGSAMAGVIFLLLGVIFSLEAMDVWSFGLADLRFIGPIALIVIGIGVALGALARDRST